MFKQNADTRFRRYMLLNFLNTEKEKGTWPVPGPPGSCGRHPATGRPPSRHLDTPISFTPLQATHTPARPTCRARQPCMHHSPPCTRERHGSSLTRVPRLVPGGPLRPNRQPQFPSSQNERQKRALRAPRGAPPARDSAVRQFNAAETAACPCRAVTASNPATAVQPAQHGRQPESQVHSNCS